MNPPLVRSMLLLACLSIPCVARATRVPTEYEVRLVATTWIQNLPQEGGPADLERPDSDTIVRLSPIRRSGALLGFSVEFASGASVLVPATKNLFPVLAFSRHGQSMVSDSLSPCDHLAERLHDALRRSQDLGYDADADAAWESFGRDKSLGLPPSIVVASTALMAGICWSQGDPYNQSCPEQPPGTDCEYLFGGHCPLGCMASSTARLLRFHAYPRDHGQGTETYYWNGSDDLDCPLDGDTLTADFTPAIDWTQLPGDFPYQWSDEERAALAAFCYRVAVGLHIRFGPKGSDTGEIGVGTLLTSHYGYAPTMRTRTLGAGPDRLVSFDIIREELYHHRPVHIWARQHFHFVCIDGWAVDSHGNIWYSKSDDGGQSWVLDDSYFSETDQITYDIISPAAPSDSVVVRPDGLGDYATIQAAIDSVSAGTHILLTDGVFEGDGNRDLDFGGKALVLRSQSGCAASCIIDCDGSPASPYRGIIMTSGETSACMVKDLTIRHGCAPSGQGGGAILHTGLGGTTGPVFVNCVLSDNVASYGGAIAMHEHVYLERCLLVRNSASVGGAVYATGAYNLLNRCTIDSSACGSASAGAVTAATSAGKLFLDQCIVTRTMVGASSNCIGGAMMQYTCSDLYGNAGGDWSYSGSCISSQAGKQGNISSDPLFCNAAYELDPLSPCLSASCGVMGARSACPPTPYLVPGHYGTIAAAVESVPDGATIELTEDWYEGEGNVDIVVTRPVTVRSTGGDPSGCIIDLGGSSNEPHRFAVVSTPSGRLTLEGITIQNGYVAGAGAAGTGGGVLVTTAGELDLVNCVLQDCFGTGGGGFGVVPGGMSGGSVDLTGCRVIGCGSSAGGGGGTVENGQLHASTTLFWGSSGTDFGARAGGLLVKGENATAIATLEQCTFVANSLPANSSALGTAVAVVGSATAVIHGCALVDGVGPFPAAGCSGATAYLDVECTDVYGNDQGWVGCLASFAPDEENLNFSADPEFCDAENGDFGSTVLNEWSAECGQVGAYGPCAVARGWARQDDRPFLEVVGRNPSKEITLRFGLPVCAQSTSVAVLVNDASGRCVRRLFVGQGDTRAQTITWDGRTDAGTPVASGVYFVALRGKGIGGDVQRVVLIR